MSPRITHSKVSGKPNPTDASKVGGKDWDADHVIDGLTIGTDVQAHDTTLDALAAFDANGIIVQYGTDQFTARTLTGTANEITVTNGAGASGNPTFSLPSALTFTGKTVTGGTFNGITASLVGSLSMNGDVILTHPLTPTPDNTPSSLITLGVGAGAALAPIHSTQYLTLLGFQAGAALTTEDHITAVGAWSLSSYNAGGTNTGITAIGIDSMRSLTSGQQNVAVGEYTLTSATSASYTTAVGYNAMLSFGAGGTYNSAFGYFALNGSSGTPATGLGNTALGSYALTGIAGTGAYNTAVGMQALFAVAQANGNVGIGYQAGLTVTTGYANTIIGTFAGSATLATGHDNILIGTTNNVADTPLSSTSNYLNIGNFIYGTSAGLTISPITTGSATLTGSSSGSTKLQAAAAASGTLTLPAATDTLVGKATTDILTNKSMDGGSNTFTNIPGSAITGAALTKTDDTNVTLTLGGTPATALNRAASITVGWTGTLAPSRGGTGISSLGTGVATALGVNVGSAGAFVTFNGALGTPSSGTLSNCTGLPVSTGISGLGTGVATALASGVREKLTANRTYYVRTDGSDSNDGLANTAGGAFLTIQKAVDVVSGIDIGIYTVTIQVGAGTYTSGISVAAQWVGSGTVEIVGNTTTPTNCVISTTSAHCVTVSKAARLSIKGFRLQTTTSGSCVNASSYGSVTLTGSMNFHTCANFHLLANGGTITSVGGNSYTITGNAAAHLYSAGTGSKLEVTSNTVTLTGTLTFSTAFAQAETLSVILSYYSTFSGGTVTGTRYSVSTNSIINTGGGGASHYPGSVGGTTSSGGIYV